MVVVMLLLLINNLQLQEKLLLLEELGVGRVHLGWALFVGLLVRRDVLVVFELLHLQSGRPFRREMTSPTPLVESHLKLMILLKRVSVPLLK